jgi:hypothetical protein
MKNNINPTSKLLILISRKRRLIEIKDVVIPQDQLDRIRQVRATKSDWSNEYHYFLRKMKMGSCCVCYELPSKLATFKVGTAFMLERYCDNCISHIYDNLDGIDKKMIIK